MAADRLEDVIGDAQFGKLRDDRVPEIVEAQARQPSRVTESAPGCVPT
jgi:hypothetical protein